MLRVFYPLATCPKTWFQLRDSCYKFPSNTLTWTAAKSVCEAMESKLAVVSSRKENEALAPNVEKRTWIGFHRHPSDTSRWQWIDGSKVFYTNWIDGQPDNSQGEEHCAEMLPASGRWNDMKCTDHLHYVCEMSGRSDKIIIYKVKFHIYATGSRVRSRPLQGRKERGRGEGGREGRKDLTLLACAITGRPSN